MNETIAKTLILNKGFPERIVHLDLKGAPLRVDAYRELFPLLHQNGATGLLIEYEDMFPFTGRLSTLARRNAYSKEDIQQIIQLSTSSNLEVIPLVQTFGHLEFVLKQPPFTKLSENALELNTICISNNESWTVITEMIDQIRSLHQSSTRIHIGADEAYHVGEDAICREKLKKTFDEHKDSMGVAHIARRVV
ncbi:unnamed protein product, partial [Mesorhabditis belari]|uniref:beta-N-acetylhexosaminidase n=1 Tax=Mesorhabditis belari TaxID=2138241 RepID=A0AAF3F3U6_9BILA